MSTPTSDTREETLHDVDASDARPAGLQLVVAWCREDPSRVGEVIDVNPGPSTVIGRMPGDEAAAPVRRRPGRDEPRGPLTESRLSKQHLRLTGVDRRWIEVERLGRNSVIVDSHPLVQAPTIAVPEEVAKMEARAWPEGEPERTNDAEFDALRSH